MKMDSLSKTQKLLNDKCELKLIKFISEEKDFNDKSVLRFKKMFKGYDVNILEQCINKLKGIKFDSLITLWLESVVKLSIGRKNGKEKKHKKSRY